MGTRQSMRGGKNVALNVLSKWVCLDTQRPATQPREMSCKVGVFVLCGHEASQYRMELVCKNVLTGRRVACSYPKRGTRRSRGYRREPCNVVARFADDCAYAAPR